MHRRTLLQKFQVQYRPVNTGSSKRSWASTKQVLQHIPPLKRTWNIVEACSSLVADYICYPLWREISKPLGCLREIQVGVHRPDTPSVIRLTLSSIFRRRYVETIGVVKLEDIGGTTLVDERHNQMITQFTTLNLTQRALKNEIIRSSRRCVY
jgi:hypothetical protein